MSDFARVMEMALAGGAAPEDISGKPPPSLSEAQAAAEAETAKAQPHQGEHAKAQQQPPQAEHQAREKK
jgi:hypothetical protein